MRQCCSRLPFGMVEATWRLRPRPDGYRLAHSRAVRSDLSLPQVQPRTNDEVTEAIARILRGSLVREVFVWECERGYRAPGSGSGPSARRRRGHQPDRGAAVHRPEHVHLSRTADPARSGFWEIGCSTGLFVTTVTVCGQSYPNFGVLGPTGRTCLGSSRHRRYDFRARYRR